MEVLQSFPEEVESLLHHLSTLQVNGQTYGPTQFAMTNYITFMFVAITVLAIVMFLAVKRLKMVPDSKLSNAVEALAQFVRDDIAASMIHHNSRSAFPFLATLFFFILTNNIVGLIPGCKPGTGTMGIAVALSLSVFVYFNYVGFKNQGFFGYLKSFVPSGVPLAVAPIIWVIEVFSAFLRVFTLSVRIFANMFAGHIILGIFAILTSLFVQPMIADLSAKTIAGALPALGWLLLMTALYLLEVLVAFVQAYVFTLLSAVYIGQAAEAH
ncbi:MAG: F0F1 ATP synthase subunit A [Actinobacteria bacterium]|nr:MAG: F0F1 ATP synthase subunit A [Actinomycetota bacterium]